MLVYDVYIMEHGKNYYKKYHLRGSEEKFADLHVILSFYKKEGIIERFYMFELDPADAKETENA